MTLTIEYLDGREECYEFTPQAENVLNAVTRLKRVLESEHLTLELDNEVVIIFTHHIRHLRLSPPPQRYPEDTIRNARRVEL